MNLSALEFQDRMQKKSQDSSYMDNLSLAILCQIGWLGQLLETVTSKYSLNHKLRSR